MTARHVLDVVEKLFTAAQHPDITGVSQYSAALSGVDITFSSGAHTYLWVAPGKPKTRPAQLPEQMPEYKTRVVHVLALLVDLLEQTHPAGWQWRLVEVEGTALAPSGLEVNLDGEVTLLRVTTGAARGEDSNPDNWAGWQLPQVTI